MTRAGPRDNLRDNKHMCDEGDVAEEHIYEEIVQDDSNSPANDEDKVSSWLLLVKINWSQEMQISISFRIISQATKTSHNSQTWLMINDQYLYL